MLFLNLVFFIFLQIFAFVIYVINKKFAIDVFLFFFLMLIFVVSYRLIGYDLSSYEYIYNYFIAGEVLRSIEPTVSLMASFSEFLGLGFRGFLFAYSFLTFSLLFILSFYLKIDSSRVLFLYIIIYLASGPMVSIRASVASLLILISIKFFYDRKFFFCMLFFSASVSFHYSSIVFIFLPFLYLLTRGSSIFISSFISSFVFVVFIYSIANIDFYFNNLYYLYLKERLSIYLFVVSNDYYNLAHIALLFRQIVVSLSFIYILFKIKDKIGCLNSPFYRFVFFVVAFSVFFSFFSVFGGFSTFGFRVFDLLSVGIVILLVRLKAVCFFPLFIILIFNFGYTFLGYKSVLLDAYSP